VSTLPHPARDGAGQADPFSILEDGLVVGILLAQHPLAGLGDRDPLAVARDLPVDQRVVLESLEPTRGGLAGYLELLGEYRTGHQCRAIQPPLEREALERSQSVCLQLLARRVVHGRKWA
jgi:threonine/homoserine efflux transporter RhtA